MSVKIYCRKEFEVEKEGANTNKQKKRFFVMGFVVLLITTTVVGFKIHTYSNNQIAIGVNNSLYEDKLVDIINDNNPYFTEEEKQCKDVFESYSPLDELGRVGVAYANVCRELQPPRGDKRGSISNVKPTGWVQVKYDCIDGKNLYNRSHLIGWQLTDEDANKANLMTGTRFFNVNGMLPYENIVDNHLEKFNHHILYRVTPVFEGDDLVARGVRMEAYCIEHQGKLVKFNVFVYNIQPNIEIDYATGESTLK